MTDRIDPVRRSINMSRVRSSGTVPEIAVRKAAHRLGYRFRLGRRDLPGSPDLVFPGRRVAMFVHGCFWHRHAGCARTTTPKTRADFWNAKFKENVGRDRRVAALLRRSGWTVAIVWECETKDPECLRKRLQTTLSRAPTIKLYSLPSRAEFLGAVNRRRIGRDRLFEQADASKRVGCQRERCER
jgi:DNA mismatch endonuclease, patch repair protein